MLAVPVAVAAVAVVAVVVLALAFARTSSGASTSRATSAAAVGIPKPPPAVAAHRRHRARAEAKNLISRLRLPAGAVALTRKPAGDGGALSRPPSRAAGVTTLVDQHTWWRVPGSAASVLDYLSAHPPHGGKLTESGSQGSGRGPATSGFVGFSWPPVGKLLADRQLFVEAVNLIGGGVGVRVDAQVQWIIPRPVSERIPRGVHEIDVTRGVPGKAPSISIKTVKPHVIQALVAMVNSLEIAQPGAWSCPAVTPGAPVVTFTFRARDGGTVLASASQLASSQEPTTPCDPMAFSVRGHAETPLLGGATVVRRAGHLLGVHLQTAPGPGVVTGVVPGPGVATGAHQSTY